MDTITEEIAIVWWKYFIRRQYLVQINYKSGTSMKAWFNEFHYNSKEMTWTVHGREILKMGINEIESIWVLKTRICVFPKG